MTSLAQPVYLIWSPLADLIFFNCVGVIICLYSLHVELSKEKNPNYRAMCDFNEHMSCSRVLTSKYAHGFGFMHLLFGEKNMMNSRNCNLGLVLYISQILISLCLPASIAFPLLFYSAAISCVGCVYLAYVLFAILKDVCVVCITTYIINGCLLYITYYNS